MVDVHESAPVLRFADWAGVRLELLWAYDSPVDAGWRMATSPASRDWSAWLLRRGSVTLESAAGTLRSQPNRWLILWHEETLEQTFSKDASLLSIRFRFDRPDNRCLFDDGPAYALPAADHRRLDRVALQLVRFTATRFPERLELWRQPVPFDTYLRSQQLLATWARVFVDAMCEAGHRLRTLTPADDRLQRAIALLNGAALAEPAPVDRLRRETGLTIRQLDRLFVTGLGLTAHHFFERRRLQVAQASLRSEATPIKSIAYHLGFRQLSHFSAWFRRQTGYAPRDYRNSARRGTTPGVRRLGAPSPQPRGR